MNRLAIAAVTITLTFSVFAETQSPYIGQESREIKALSEQEIEAYLNGKGMGYAKAAELNQYPGPRHVLDMAEQLDLTEEQSKKTQAVFDAMKSAAIAFGQQLVKKEQELDRQFADESINTASLKKLLLEIGTLQARIRFVHLDAHLEQKALLSRHQVQQYVQLRGYSTSHGKQHTHSD